MRADGLPRKRYRPRRRLEVFYDLGLLAAFVAGVLCVIAPRGLAFDLAGSGLLVVVAIHAVLLFHDCMHQSAFANRRLETWIARAIGAFYGCPFHFLRDQHLRHHRHAGLVDDDPEALHLHEHDAAERPHGKLLMRIGRRWTGAFVYTWLLQFGEFTRWLLRQLRRVEDRELLRATAVDVACMLAVWVPLTTWLVAQGVYLRFLVFAFLVPAIAGLAIVYLVAKPLHTLMIPFRLRDASYAQRQFCVTRTFETHPLFAALVCNLNYHLEHHLYPHVSRWDLPSLSRELRPVLVEYARQHQLPLAIHDGYADWLKRYSKVSATFNPISDWKQWTEFNRRFRYATFNAPEQRCES
jgi:fatty acid desaturase